MTEGHIQEQKKEKASTLIIDSAVAKAPEQE